jgi:anti-sigma regulatory factor (Ser/Thr protein kinase)
MIEDEAVEGLVEVRRHFEPVLESAPAARRFAKEVARQWGLASLVEKIELAVSELAANAVLHARSRFVLVLSRDEAGLRISVTDGKPSDVADPGLPAPDASGGRGIPIVSAISDRWGVDLGGEGKTVWAEFSVDGS